jgi:HSP20 family protein
MAIIRYSPFRDIERLQHQMNRLFDESLAPTLGEVQHWLNNPAVEISETEDALELKLEIPGIEAKDLDIQVSKDSVSVSGERKQESKTEEKGITRSEFRYGKFQRVIPLPVRVDNTQVKAEYKEGILHLNLPKAEEEKNKVVKVNVG